jgi:predicted transcriptional regulator
MECRFFTRCLSPSRPARKLPAMLTSAQIRGARGLLNWSAADLARRAGVSWKTIQRAEGAPGGGVPRVHAETLDKIERTLEEAGVDIIPESQGSPGGGPGVRLRRS